MVVVVIVVYIPIDANVSSALNHLQLVISKQQQEHPKGIHVVAEDFNKARLTSVLPKFHQHVRFPTSRDRTPDHVYSVQGGLQEEDRELIHTQQPPPGVERHPSPLQLQRSA